MPRHGVDLLDNGEAVVGVGAQRMRKGHGVNLVDSPWPSFDLSSGHVNYDDGHIVRIENRYSASSARVDAHDFHGLHVTR